MVICGACGTRIATKVVICPNCAGRIDATDLSLPMQEPPKTSWLKIAVILALVVAGSVAAMLFLRGR